MNKVLEEISKIGILPVVVLEDAKDAKPLAHALCAGGLPCAEVTFRTAAAKESIAIMRKEFPEMLVGAGTVLIVKHCIEKNVPVTPGTCTPSDVQKCYRLGLDVVKFFPAEAAGGLKMIKSIAAPYTQMKFIPTGGINANNMKDYLEYDRILAIGGSWMVKGDIIKSGDFDKVEALTRQAVEKLREVR